MPFSLTELLLPQVILEVVSRIKAGRGPLGSWLGFHPDTYNEKTVELEGPNTLRGMGSIRNVTYRYFDHTRTVTVGRAPGTGPGTVNQQPMAQNTVSVARFHEKIPLNYEFLGNLSPMIGPVSQIDAGGQAYIEQQTQYLTERGNNIVEAMAAGMMRDSLYMLIQGDNILPSFTAPTGTQVGFQVPFLIPAGNKGQLNMLGGGNIIAVPWNQITAPIIGNIQSVIAAYAQLSRYTMTDIWINSLMWYNVLVNTEVRNTAGSLNTPFAEFDREDEGGWNKSGPANKYSAILKGQPTITWHFCDDTLALASPGGGTIDPSYNTLPASALASLTKLVPDNMAIFCTQPNPQWCKLYYGGEYVVENPGMMGMLRMGWYFWHEYVTQPSACELIAVLNAVPWLIIPAVIAPGIVIF